jgi:hypothetical protein
MSKPPGIEFPSGFKVAPENIVGQKSAVLGSIDSRGTHLRPEE